MTDSVAHQLASIDHGPSVFVTKEHIMYLKRIMDHFQDKSEEDHLLLIEKILYLTLEYLSTNSTNELTFDFIGETKSYLERMNQKSVAAFSKGQLEESAKLIAHIVDLLNQKNILKLYENESKLFESKILTYNNLSCIYRKLGKFSLALKVISLALELEEKLASEDYGASNISIISTYLNKASILAQMEKHGEALETVNQALDKIKQIEAKSNQNEEEKMHIQNLKMSAFYSMGTELVHLKKLDEAILSYENANSLAKILGKKHVINKIEKAISSLRKTK